MLSAKSYHCGAEAYGLFRAVQQPVKQVNLGYRRVLTLKRQ